MCHLRDCTKMCMITHVRAIIQTRKSCRKVFTRCVSGVVAVAPVCVVWHPAELDANFLRPNRTSRRLTSNALLQTGVFETAMWSLQIPGHGKQVANAGNISRHGFAKTKSLITKKIKEPNPRQQEDKANRKDRFHANKYETGRNT